MEYSDTGIQYFTDWAHLVTNNVHIGTIENVHDVTPADIGKRIEITEDAWNVEAYDKGCLKYGKHYIRYTGDITPYVGYYIELDGGAAFNVQQIDWQYI
jgi:hypothetical protein